MKKVLWSAAIALFILTLTGCARTAGPAPTEDHPPQITVENVPKSPAPVEKEQISFSASNILLTEDDAENEEVNSDTEPVLPTEPAPSPTPQGIPASKAAPAPVQQTVTFEPAVQERPKKTPSLPPA